MANMARCSRTPTKRGSGEPRCWSYHLSNKTLNVALYILYTNYAEPRWSSKIASKVFSNMAGKSPSHSWTLTNSNGPRESHRPGKQNAKSTDNSYLQQWTRYGPSKWVYFQVKYPEEERSVREGLMAFMANSCLGCGPTHAVFRWNLGNHGHLVLGHIQIKKVGWLTFGIKKSQTQTSTSKKQRKRTSKIARVKHQQFRLFSVKRGIV